MTRTINIACYSEQEDNVLDLFAFLIYKDNKFHAQWV